MTPPSCGARLLIEEHHWLACSALCDHPDTHTAYYRDRLYQWPQTHPLLIDRLRANP